MLESTGSLAQTLGAAFVTSSLGASELIIALLVAAGFLVNGAREVPHLLHVRAKRRS
jgi:hypothetical protein